MTTPDAHVPVGPERAEAGTGNELREPEEMRGVVCVPANQLVYFQWTKKGVFFAETADTEPTHRLVPIVTTSGNELRERVKAETAYALAFGIERDNGAVEYRDDWAEDESVAPLLLAREAYRSRIIASRVLPIIEAAVTEAEERGRVRGLTEAVDRLAEIPIERGAAEWLRRLAEGQSDDH